MSERLKNAIAGLLLIGMFALNRFLKIDVELIVRFVTLFGILFHAWILGKRLFPKAGGIAQAFFGGVLFLSILSLIQVGVFYVGMPLDELTDFWSVLASMLVCQLLNLLLPEEAEPVGNTKTEWSARRTAAFIVTLCIALGSLGYVLIGAWRAGTTDSLRTPWPLLPPGTLLAVSLLWLGIPLSAWLVRSRIWTAFQSAFAILATTALAPLVYLLGFGFDGFLHLAGERQILQTGMLFPKPLYYMGQYAFTTWLTRTSGLPIEWTDRWLVPIAAAFLIPFALYLLVTREDTERKTLAPFALLLFPLAPFIATTPQSFSYILGAAALLLSFGSKEDVHWLAPILLALWAVATHPLAGIPLLFVAIALLSVRSASQPTTGRFIKRISAAAAIVAAGISVPILFYFLSAKGGATISWNIASLFSFKPWAESLASITPWIGNRYVLWPAWASLVRQALPVVALTASIGTLFTLSKERRAPTIVLICSGILLFTSGTFLRATGEFAFLIDYERGNYAERLFILSTFCLAIAALPGFTWITQRLRRYPSLGSIFLLAFFGAIAAAQSYNALPRHDALVTGRGWSVGSADVEAVQTIDRDAGTRPYTVLANQSVSAAAVSLYGFRRYNDDIFYYPIPTGGPLYETFLRMTYQEPSLDTVREAAKLGETDLVYVVLNDYWWRAEQVSQSLAGIADNSWSIGKTDAGLGRSISVYKFERKTASSR